MPIAVQDRTSYLLRRAPRAHPYERVRPNSLGQYYDFKARPDLIDKVLEDFTPHDGCPGVQEFYALLRHINRHDGPFETTDCGLCQTLYVSRNSVFPEKAGWVGGRVMFMYRQPERNYRIGAVRRLIKKLRRELKAFGRRYSYIGFVVGPFPTIFRATGKQGYQIDIEFAMWGDTFDEGLKRFPDVVRAMERAIKGCEASSP